MTARDTNRSTDVSELECGHQEIECGHCGRAGMIYGLVAINTFWQIRLCHSTKDGIKAIPDCYTLVSQGTERFGSRIGAITL
jgi:hypothetical protein